MSSSQIPMGNMGENGQTAENSSADDNEKVAHQSLKPADGGRDAWQVLTAAFFFEALLWGASSSIPTQTKHCFLRRL
jgi:hypothetical protein